MTLSLSTSISSTWRLSDIDFTAPSSFAPAGAVPGATALVGTPSSRANACAAVPAGSGCRGVEPRVTLGSTRPPSVMRPTIGATTPLVGMSESHGPTAEPWKIDTS
jgi:hypothetical protein